MSTNKRFLSGIFVFLCYSIILAIKIDQDFVKVSLYYESLCPYSREFVYEQLFPAYVKIGKTGLITDLVPYGKANHTKINGTWTFKCQHGPKECLGNKIQACVLAHPLDQDDKVGFVNCMMNSTNPASLSNAENCALDHRVQWSDLNTCILGIEGDNLLAHYGDRTKALDPKLLYVPHILFNGIFNTTLENAARNDFFKTVCGLFNVKPDGCNNRE